MLNVLGAEEPGADAALFHEVRKVLALEIGDDIVGFGMKDEELALGPVFPEHGAGVDVLKILMMENLTILSSNNPLKGYNQPKTSY